MKKIYNFMMIALMGATMGLTFTSCEDDVEEARVLSGEWQGDLGMYFSDGYYEYDADYTDIRFEPHSQYHSSGWGEEIDYFYRNCPIRYQSFYFEWRIDFGVLYLHYPYNPELDVSIRDYRLTYNFFTGWIGDYKFRLNKLVGYYDWNLYNPTSYYGYQYYDDYYDPYYYGKTRAGEANDSVQAPAAPRVDPEHFTFGRRFKMVENKKAEQ